MPIILIVLIIFIFIILFSVQFILYKNKDFSHEISTQLRKHKFKYSKSYYPGLFKIGPYKTDPIEFEIGTVQIQGANHKSSYYRIVELQTDTNQNKQTWAKITTNWFKPTKIEFRPSLSSLK